MRDLLGGRLGIYFCSKLKLGPSAKKCSPRASAGLTRGPNKAGSRWTLGSGPRTPWGHGRPAKTQSRNGQKTQRKNSQIGGWIPAAIAALCLLASGSAMTQSHPAARTWLDGDFIQGGLVRGRTTPGARVKLDEIEVMVAEDGRFILGFDRDFGAAAVLESPIPMAPPRPARSKLRPANMTFSVSTACRRARSRRAARKSWPRSSANGC